MKTTRKTLSLLLAVAMLFSCLAISMGGLLSAKAEEEWIKVTAANGRFNGEYLSWGWGTEKIQVTDSADGVNFFCSQSDYNYREKFIKDIKALPLDGFNIKMTMENPNQQAGFVVWYMGAGAKDNFNYANNAHDALGLAFDTANGKLYFLNDAAAVRADGQYRFTGTPTTLIEDDLLKGANINGKEVILGLSAGADGAYTVKVTVGNKSIVAENALTAEKIASIVSLTDLTKVYFGLSIAGFNSGATNVTVSGIRSEEKRTIDWGSVVAANGRFNGEYLSWGWGTEKIQVTDSADGVNFFCSQSDYNYREKFIKDIKALPLDGFNIKMTMENPNQQAGFVVWYMGAGAKDNFNYANNAHDALGLAFDTANGKLYFLNDAAAVRADGQYRFTGTPTTLIEDDLLKGANINGKEVILGLSAGADGAYTVKVTVGNKSIVAENALTAEKIASIVSLTDLTKVYFGLSIAGFNSGATNVTVAGIGSMSNGNPALPYINMINDLSEYSDAKLLANGQDVRKVRAAYDELDDSIKAGVTNYAALVAIENKYYAMAAEADAGMIIMNTRQARRVMNGSSAKINVTDVATGGVHLKFTSFQPLGEGYVAAANLDGLKLQFDNFVTMGNNYAKGQLSVTLGIPEGEDILSGAQEGFLTLVMDPAHGLIYAIPSDSLSKVALTYESYKNGYKVLESDLIKGANVENRRFSFSFAAKSDGSVDLTVEIAGQKLTGNIPTSVLDKATRLGNRQYVSVMIGNADPSATVGSCGYDVDWVAIDPGQTGGKAANLTLTDSSAVLSGSATLDQGNVFLKKTGDSVEFTVKASSLEVRTMSYSNAASLDVYVNGEKVKTLTGLKNTDIWREIFTGANAKQETAVRLVNAGDNPLVIDGFCVDEASAEEPAPPVSIKYEELTIADLNGQNYWPSNFSVAASPIAGVRYSFKDATVGMRYGIGVPRSLDGMYLKFNHLEKTGSTNPVVSFVFSNTANFEPLTEGNFMLVFDSDAGAVKMARGKNYLDPTLVDTLIQSDSLKYDAIRGKVIVMETKADGSGGFDISITVADGTPLTGKIPAELVERCSNLEDWSEARLTVTTPMRSAEIHQTFNVDIVEYYSTALTADAVMQMIDSIGVVTYDSMDAIDAAIAAYESLSEKDQNKVENYDSLITMQNFCLGMEYDDMIAEAESLIDEIGTVGYQSGEAIRAAQLAFSRLSSEQAAKVKNAAVLEAAKTAYYNMTADKMVYENYANSVSPLYPSMGSLGGWWQASYNETLANKAQRINFVNAIRDVRNGPATVKELDGLFLRFGNLTAEEGSNGAGTKLSIQIGSSGSNYRGGANLSAMAFVLDTYTGTLYAYPGARVMFQDDCLKQSALEGKEFSLRFDLLEEENYLLTMQVEDKQLKNTVPSSIIHNSLINLKPGAVWVAVTPWVNSADGSTDNSTHTFSVDFLSAQSSGKYAFEDMFTLMDEIDQLPSVIKMTDVDRVAELMNAYRDLPRTLRSYVNNYSKLSDAINQTYALMSDEYSEWENLGGTGNTGENSGSAAESSPGGTSPETGENLVWVAFAFGLLVAAAWLVYATVGKVRKSN